MSRIEANHIKPKKRGIADFFSWQLYRWVKAKPHATQIWRGTWNSATGIDRDRPVLYIGHMDSDTPGELWFHGRNLRNLCCYRQKIESYAYGPGHDTKKWVDVTEGWWSEYMEKGVCAIHVDYAHDWETEGDKRTCSWCGAVENRVVEQVERVTWVKGLT